MKTLVHLRLIDPLEADYDPPSELRQQIEDYLEFRTGIKKQKTVDLDSTALNSFAEFRDTWPISYRDIHDWRRWLDDQKVTVATINTYWRHFRVFLNYLESIGEITDNPVPMVTEFGIIPKPGTPPPKGLSLDEIKQFFNHLETQRDDLYGARNLVLCRFLYHTGARIGETVNLRWSDVDLAGQFATFAAATTKNATGRRVFFSDQIKSDLIHLWAIYAANDFKPRYVFSSLPANGLSVGRLRMDSASQIVSECFTAAGLDHHAHELRHSHAYHSLMRGASLANVGRQLGHKSILSTQAYLNNPQDDDRRMEYGQLWNRRRGVLGDGDTPPAQESKPGK